jgi:hypothetical protein
MLGLKLSWQGVAALTVVLAAVVVTMIFAPDGKEVILAVIGAVGTAAGPTLLKSKPAELPVVPHVPEIDTADDHLFDGEEDVTPSDQ